MKTTDTHVYFWEGQFSNWHPCKIISYEWEYENSEQLFMALKALMFEDFETYALIKKTGNPKEAKALGRKVKNFDAEIWDREGYHQMVKACEKKFRQNWDLKKTLIDTGSKILVEASPLDKIWGVGLHYDDPLILNEKNWKGQNKLGKALMEVRNLLTSQP